MGGNGNFSALPTFAADERTNSILLGGDALARAKMRAVILNLDTPETQFGNTRVFRLKFANAEDLAKVLQGVVQTNSTKGGAAAGGAAPATGNRENLFEVTADKSLNALVVTASPTKM